MEPSKVEKAAQLFLDARRMGYQLEYLPEDCRPRNLEEGYAIQSRLFDLLGEQRVGWFTGGTNSSKIITEKFAAPIRSGTLHPSGAGLRKADFVTFKIDVEFGFSFARDLEPRAKGYDRAEILNAIAGVHPTLDIVNSHLVDFAKAGWPSILADNGTDGGVVWAPGKSLAEAGNLNAIEVKLIVNGKQVLTGDGRRIMGNPVEAVIWFVGHMSERKVSIVNCDFLATGSCLDNYWGKVGDHVVADFGVLGRVEARFTD